MGFASAVYFQRLAGQPALGRVGWRYLRNSPGVQSRGYQNSVPVALGQRLHDTPECQTNIHQSLGRIEIEQQQIGYCRQTVVRGIRPGFACCDRRKTPARLREFFAWGCPIGPQSVFLSLTRALCWQASPNATIGYRRRWCSKPRHRSRIKTEPESTTSCLAI